MSFCDVTENTLLQINKIPFCGYFEHLRKNIVKVRIKISKFSIQDLRETEKRGCGFEKCQYSWKL